MKRLNKKLKIGILEPEHFSVEAREELKKLGSVHSFSGKNINSFLLNLDVLFLRLQVQIDKKFLNMAPRLRWICSPTTGHTHLDEAELNKRNITLLSLKGEQEFLKQVRATPEYTFGLMLAIIRNLGFCILKSKNKNKNRKKILGQELYGNKVGIIGLGRVGSRLAEYCHHFGASVGWLDPQGKNSSKNWRRFKTKQALIKASNIIVLCASYKNGQNPILGRSEFLKMKNKFLVNTARGELVNEKSLLTAIEKNILSGVAVDVIANENKKNNNYEKWKRLTLKKNLILTSHIGGWTKESVTKTEKFLVQKLKNSLY